MPYGSKLHTPPTNYHPSCSTRAIQKSLTRNEKCLRVFWKKSQKNGPLAEKNDRKSKRTRQKKTGDRKGESDDSPEIPDRRKTSDIPSLPLGSGGAGVSVHTPASLRTASLVQCSIDKFEAGGNVADSAKAREYPLYDSEFESQ